MEPFELTGHRAATLLAERKLSCEELVRSCLSRIAARDSIVRAWTWLDAEHAIRRARELDKRLVGSGPMGALHGLPIGVKDVIDTADMPTQHNSALYRDNRPGQDASCIRIARASGALILGKTDTVEFAAGGRKALTTHPLDPRRTPGGSSSGSAAAVADGHVPLAFGTQTVGSHIRPASFNGIYGFKPTHGVVAASGVRPLSPTLDTLGWYGRSVDCLVLMAKALRLRGMNTMPDLHVNTLKVGIARTHNWNKAEPSAHDAVMRAGRLLEDAGARVDEISLPDGFENLDASLRIILQAEAGVHFLADYLAHSAKLHVDFRDRVEGGATLAPQTLVEAYNHAALCRMQYDAMFGVGLDVMLTPAATGEAPLGLQSTGDWTMNAIWTLLHAPCVSIPGHLGPNEMPVGVQVVGPRFGDSRLMAASRAIAELVDPKRPAN